MSPNEVTLRKLYTSFQQRDFRSMGECYHDQATFRDPAFTLKSGEEIRKMWEMLCTSGKDTKVEFRNVWTNGNSGSIHWEARYTFSRTGRKVHNIIDATFEFKNGLIIRHVDHFDFYRWSKQALGLSGRLFGWSSFLQKKVQQKAMMSLSKFQSSAATEETA